MKQPRKPGIKNWLTAVFAAATLGLGSGAVLDQSPGGFGFGGSNVPDPQYVEAAAPDQTANLQTARYTLMTPDQILIASAREGDLFMMSEALNRGADVHYNADQPLREAAVAGQYASAEWLIGKGADVKANDSAALKDAASFGHENIVYLLQRNGANIHADQENALLNAATTGSADIVAYLANNGADVNAGNGAALRAAIQTGRTDVVDILLQHKAAVDPEMITTAAVTGRVETLKSMASHGVSLADSAALQAAALTGKFDTARFLADHGARSSETMIDMIRYNDPDGKMADILKSALPNKTTFIKIKGPRA